MEKTGIAQTGIAQNVEGFRGCVRARTAVCSRFARNDAERRTVAGGMSVASQRKNTPREEAVTGSNTGLITGLVTGLAGPVMAGQAIEFARDFFARKNFAVASRNVAHPAGAVR
jgi:hypothetical protein